MPRSSKSVAGQIVDFFRKAPMDTVDIIMGLCKDAVSERKAHAANIREAQAKASKARGKVKGPKTIPVPTPVGPVAVAAPKKGKPGPKPGSKRGRKPKGASAANSVETAPGLPEQDSPDPDPGDLFETGNPGDAPDLEQD